MSYTVLARRYRSATFDEVIGQEHVAQTLKKAIESDRVAHAYLFNGTRGVGKTSMARIMAKALNCHASDGPTTQPCGKCDSCQAVARGDDMDVIEIDAASNTGVDNVREIIENSQYRPARSRFKVYIIDEVHMLSKSAFNALLKTLEEPPGHVKFILATTEPEKVLPTILSRCQRYDFRNIPTREIAGHLKAVCTQEKIKADDAALLLVAKAGAGSMRDSLSLLDRLLSIGEKHLTVESIEHLLGLPKSQLVFDLARAIGDGDVKATLTQANSMVQSGLSVDGLIAALTDHLRNLLILRTCGSDSELVEVPGLAVDELVAQAERFDPVALTQDVVILEELRRHVRQSQAGRALLDATLVRMALSDQFSSVSELLGRLDGAGGAAARPRPAGAGRAPQTPVKSPAQAPRSAVPPAPAAEKKKADEPVDQRSEVRGQTLVIGEAANASSALTSDLRPLTSAQDDDDDLPAPGKVWEGPKVSLAALMKQHAAAMSESLDHAAAAPQVEPTAAAGNASNVEAVDPNDLPGVWRALLDLVAQKGPMLQSLLAQGTFVGIRDGRAVIRYAAEQAFFVNQFERNGKKDQVRDALSQVLNQPIGVQFEVAAEAEAEAGESKATGNGAGVAPPPRTTPQARHGGPPPPPPPAPAGPPAIRVTPELVQSIRDAEPLVRSLMDRLGAQIIKVE